MVLGLRLRVLGSGDLIISFCTPPKRKLRTSQGRDPTKNKGVRQKPSRKEQIKSTKNESMSDSYYAYCTSACLCNGDDTGLMNLMTVWILPGIVGVIIATTLKRGNKFHSRLGFIGLGFKV